MTNCFESNYFPTGIALQALAQLGLQNELPVKKAFDAIIEWQNREIGGWYACDTDGAGIPGIRCTSVFLEALAEHPVLRNSEAAMFSLEYFRNIQNEDGTWGGKYRDLNTFTVVNALYRQGLLDLLRRGVNGT